MNKVRSYSDREKMMDDVVEHFRMGKLLVISADSLFKDSLTTVYSEECRKSLIAQAKGLNQKGIKVI